MRKKLTKPLMSALAGLTLLCFLPAQTASSSTTAAFLQGNDLVLERNYAEALRAYDTFVKENPQHYLVPAALWTMANIYFAINADYENAAELYRRVATDNAGTEWEYFAYDRLGTCYEAQQDWKEAVDIYQSAVGRLSGSGEDDARLRIAQLRGSMISCYQNMNDHKSLIRVYEEMLADDPTAASAPENQFNLAHAYLDMEDLDQAAQNFVVVVERYPTTQHAQRVQSEHAELLASQYDYDWTPFNTFWSALRLSQTGHYDEARAEFDKVLEAKENTDMVYAVNLQKELIEYRENGDATALMEKVASSREDYPYGLGGVSIDGLNAVLQDIVEAQEVLISNPEDVGTYARIAFGYYQTRAYHHGIETYKKAIEIAPDNAGLYNMLGYCYISLQDYVDAINTFEQLVAVAPDDPNSYDSMAEAYYTKGDTTMAIQFYQKSLSVDSTFTNPYYMLGRIYQEQGQSDRAIENLERYLELDPGGFQAQNAQNLLNQMYPPPSDDEE